MKGARKKAVNDHNERMVMCHTLAGLYRAKKLPDLDKLLVRDEPKRKQSVEEMARIAEFLAAAFEARSSTLD